MTNHTNWTGDLTEGATIFVATQNGQFSKCRVESVRDRYFSVEGIEPEFDKLTACSIDGLQHSYPDDFESREIFGLLQQKNRLMSLQIDSLSLLQVQFMLAGLELARKRYGYQYRGSKATDTNQKCRLAMSIDDSLHPTQIAYILAGLKLSLLQTEVNHDCEPT
ncbi:hypothetical protein [Citrobacter cronae]|uniref:Uncharacterized protein n=1 Tax=Citrobacter cronae TaxID=1748967 RepID=A0A7X1BS13_9ENTR|nr:hypothetical protein [Citrobacter cronae]EBD5844842.1 hypothetical protein [Salmonella enterica]EDD5452172.1 hypothetical protein [Salmonella enterica subsp. enterica serovar Paratyphi B]EBD6593558.1 hypothetical protein [Salmonella enterica]EDE4810729.1 hypothetical protein [Salmonella enterica subsp. enterica serovar Paratyphi B]MBC2622030.1 hypothetical protein [Citrobacter cronae]